MSKIFDYLVMYRIFYTTQMRHKMNFWEKGFLTTGITIMLTASAYAGHVWLQSRVAGMLAPPELWPFVIALSVSVGASLLALAAIGLLDKPHQADGPRLSLIDERERQVSTQAQASAGHVQSFGIYASLIAFFIHRDGNVLFYTVLAAALASDLSRCFLQVILYRRPV
jgi:hypothetical protein